MFQIQSTLPKTWPPLIFSAPNARYSSWYVLCTSADDDSLTPHSAAVGSRFQKKNTARMCVRVAKSCIDAQYGIWGFCNKVNKFNNKKKISSIMITRFIRPNKADIL